MHRLIRAGTKAQMEVLGFVEPSSPKPRRNTSNGTVEALRSGNKAETRFRLVSALYPLCFRFPLPPSG